MDIQKAIAEIRESGLSGNQVHQGTLELALTALQKQVEREKGCAVCNKGVKIMYSPEDDLYPYAAEFCPHCGKKLK